MNKVILFISLITLMLFVPIVNADLGTFKQNDCVNIKTILNTTAVNISTISYPNSSLALSNLEMTKTGQTFNYSFCDTSPLGTYTYDYFDVEGNVYVNTFKIGNDILIPIVLLIAGFLLLCLGIWKRIPIIGFASGVLIMLAGVYLLIYGLGMEQTLYTNQIGYVCLFLGLAISFTASYEWYAIGPTGEQEEE